MAKKFNIDHDSEYFKIPVEKGGKTTTHFIPKHSSPSVRKMEVKGLGLVPREEVIEAIQKFFPQMEKTRFKRGNSKIKGRKTNP